MYLSFQARGSGYRSSVVSTLALDMHLTISMYNSLCSKLDSMAIGLRSLELILGLELVVGLN